MGDSMHISAEVAAAGTAKALVLIHLSAPLLMHADYAFVVTGVEHLGRRITEREAK